MSRLSGNIAVVCTAQFVVVLDATIVTTALPAVGTSLGVSHSGLSWVVTAYTLAFGLLLVPCGRVADRHGPRRVFGTGLVVFGAASVVCALAWSSEVLIGARAVQGLGAALLAPAALALLTSFTEPGSERRRAVGWWTAAAAVGGASGWVAGGVLTEYLGWRTVFWVNVPITVLALAATFLLPAGRRSGAAPRLPSSRVLAGAGLTALLLTASTSPAMYLATLYVQQVLAFPPARASLLFPAFNVAVVAGSLAGPAVVRRVGAPKATLGGFAGLAAGSGVLASLPAALPVVSLLAAFALMGTGLGVASVASTHAGTEAVDPGEQGVAAGVLSAAAQLGTAAGLALVGPLASYRAGFAGAGLVALLGLATGRLLRATGTVPARRRAASPRRPGRHRAGRTPGGPAPARTPR